MITVGYSTTKNGNRNQNFVSRMEYVSIKNDSTIEYSCKTEITHQNPISKKEKSYMKNFT